MAPNDRSRKFSDWIAIAILIVLLVAQGSTMYRHWADERRSQRANFAAAFGKINENHIMIDLSSLPAPPFDSNNVRHCFALNMGAARTVKQGLLDAEKAERLRRLFSKLRPLNESPGAGDRSTDIAVILSRLLPAERLIEAGDRASIATAVDRCTALVAKLTR
jgi:hypothetical protein